MKTIDWIGVAIAIVIILVVYVEIFATAYKRSKKNRKVDEWRIEIDKIYYGVLKTKLVDDQYDLEHYTYMDAFDALDRSFWAKRKYGSSMGTLIGVSAANRKTKTRKKNEKATFVVWWKDGNKTIETVPKDGYLYRAYLLKIDG